MESHTHPIARTHHTPIFDGGCDGGGDWRRGGEWMGGGVWAWKKSLSTSTGSRVGVGYLPRGSSGSSSCLQLAKQPDPIHWAKPEWIGGGQGRAVGTKREMGLRDSSLLY